MCASKRLFPLLETPTLRLQAQPTLGLYYGRSSFVREISGCVVNQPLCPFGALPLINQSLQVGA